MQAISTDTPAIFSEPGCGGCHSSTRDYSMNPALVYWEMTRACQLACRHCRAEAISTPHPCQLTHVESKSLLLQIAGFNRPLPHLILTGGDSCRRKRATFAAIISSTSTAILLFSALCTSRINSGANAGVVNTGRYEAAPAHGLLRRRAMP
jgi:hypothetical protein